MVISIGSFRPLLQFRTRVVCAERQSSAASGFLVAADGAALTNRHVVWRVALDAKTYRLEHTPADGNRGEAKLRDLANDLAVVGLDKRDAAFFAFDEASDSARHVGWNLPDCDRADRPLRGASATRAV